MKKQITILFTALFLFLSILSFPQSSEKALATGQDLVKVTATSLNVREKPSTSSKIIGSFKKGQIVTILAEQKGWTKVPLGKSYGWVSSSYVSKVQTISTSSTATQKSGTVTASSLNLRQSATTSSKSIGTLKKGTVVTIQSQSGSWLQVYVSSLKKTGWVSASYINVKTAAPSPSAVTAPVVAKGTTYYVTASSLNIRQQPSTSGKILTSVKKNQRVTFFEKSGSWGKIKTASGITGWASLSYLTQKAPTAPVPVTSGLVSGKTIVLDAGHGGKDSGATGENNYEKTLNLQTVEALSSLLKNGGAEVILTRSSDKYLTLSERVKISNQYQPDVFISIHYNANSSNDANGINTFYWTTNADEKELAAYIQEEVIKQTGLKNRGIKPGDFQVIRDSKNPAILVELGFISNPEEEKIIATNEYQQKAATGIYNGLVRYFSR
jgi:N-acetylmuramoyl-L-alanine amidase